MSTLLHIDSFSCGYPGGFRLKPITAEIPAGMITGIIGPNGSGKTTLFKGITGDLKPGSGSVRLNTQDLNRMPGKEKAKLLSIVMQETDTVGISVEDYVRMGRMPHHGPWQFFDTPEDVRKAAYYMELTGILHKRTESLDHLSGGEKQLAAIARALTQEPTLLLLDEPTASLDISHQVQILNLLQKLNHDTGLTVIMVIHDLNLASEYCDNLLMISDGAVYRRGTPEEVLTYQNIEEVYRTTVVTHPNPASGRPIVVIVSERTLNSQLKSFTT